MPKWKVANVYVIRCEHEVEADNEGEAIRRGMDLEDNLDTMRAKYTKTEIVERLEEQWHESSLWTSGSSRTPTPT